MAISSRLGGGRSGGATVADAPKTSNPRDPNGALVATAAATSALASEFDIFVPSAIRAVAGMSSDKSGAQNTAAIQDHIAAGRRPLRIPPDTFEIEDIVFTRNPTVDIIGESAERSTLKYFGSGAALSFDALTTAAIDQINWSRFVVDVQASTATSGIYIRNNANIGGSTRFSSLRDILIWGHQGAGLVGLRADSSITTHYTNIVARNCGKGFEFGQVGRRSSCVMMLGCHAKDSTLKGFHIKPGARNFVMQLCRTENDLGTAPMGIHIEGSLLPIGETHTLIGCESEDNYSDAVWVFENALDVRVVGGGPGTNALGNGIRMANCHACSVRTFVRAQGSGLPQVKLDAACRNNDLDIVLQAGQTPNVQDLGLGNRISVLRHGDAPRAPAKPVESTFAPTVSIDTAGNLSVTYAEQYGHVRRDGNWVHITLRIRFTPTFTTATGKVHVLGCPVSDETVLPDTGQPLMVRLDGFDLNASTRDIAARIRAGRIDFDEVRDDLARLPLRETTIVSGEELVITVFGDYRTASAV